MPNAAQRSALGVQLDKGRAFLASAAAPAATTLTVDPSTIVGAFTASGFVTIVDGSNTETVSVSAWVSPALTVGALTNAHPAGTLVLVTAASGAPTDYLPITSLTPNEIVAYLEDKNYRGSMVDVYDLALGPTHTEYDAAGDFIADPFGFLLGSFFGDVATTGGSAPFSHVFAALNSGNGEPKTLSLTDIEPVQPRLYPASAISALSIMFDSTKQISWTAKWSGFASGTVGQPTKSYTTDKIQPSWLAATTIGGTYKANVTSAQIDLARNVTVQNCLNGSRSPYVIWVGPITASGKVSFVYEDESQILNFLNNTQPSLDLAFTSGAGASQRGLTLHATRCAYSSAAKNRGQDLMTVDIGFTLVAQTTDGGASGGYSPLKATLLSSKPASTYQ